ncbi:MAG: hypothetical protein PGN11_06070 [Quadrisphaera sp.]
MTSDLQRRRDRRPTRQRLRSTALAGTALVAAATLVPAAPALAASPGDAGTGVAAVAAPTTLQPGLLSSVLGTLWGDRKTDDLARNPLTGKYDARRDPGSLYSITTAIGARDVWQQTDARGAALTGKGVTVAVVDSGVAPVQGLAGSSCRDRTCRSRPTAPHRCHRTPTATARTWPASSGRPTPRRGPAPARRPSWTAPPSWAWRPTPACWP